MRAVIAVLVLSASVIAAQARDQNDRMLGTEINRDRSENRIERLRDDKGMRDKARAEKPEKAHAEKPADRPVKKKPAKTGN